MKTRLIDGFFVYRHLGLAGCNIVLMKRFLPLLLLLCFSCAKEESESDNNIFNYNGYDSLGAQINTGALDLIINDSEISGEWQLTMIGNVNNTGSQFFSGSLNGIVTDDIHYHINLNSMIADDNVNLEGIYYL